MNRCCRFKSGDLCVRFRTLCTVPSVGRPLSVLYVVSSEQVPLFLCSSIRCERKQSGPPVQQRAAEEGAPKDLRLTVDAAAAAAAAAPKKNPSATNPPSSSSTTVSSSSSSSSVRPQQPSSLLLLLLLLLLPFPSNFFPSLSSLSLSPSVPPHFVVRSPSSVRARLSSSSERGGE